jgi:WD40 repeat protein
MRPDDAIAEIDQICDEFEREWQTGHPPDLYSWVTRGRSEYLPQLVHELVRIDIEYRTKHGLTEISLQEYSRNFAQSLQLMTGYLRERTAVAGSTNEWPPRQEISDKLSADTENAEATQRLLGPITGSDSPFPEFFLSLPLLSDSETSRFPFDFGRFVVLRELGRGGMGIVYEARQKDLGRLVALKTISVSAATEEGLRRFQHEAEAAAQLKHPGIVQVYEVGQVAGQPWISMELISGPTLSQLVRQQPLNTRQAAEFIIRICEAIAHAHSRGIVHRDIKPSNILIDEHHQPRITDFGLAKSSSRDETFTGSGDILGTAAYMSPEQARGEGSSAGTAADIYSIGAVLYRCIAGRPPFSASTTVEVLRQVVQDEPISPQLMNPEADADLSTICLKCLDKDPQRRFRSASELAAELVRYLNGEPILSRPVSRPVRLTRWCRRRPYVASSILLSGLILLILVIGIPYILLQRADRSRVEAVAVANAARADTQKYFASMMEIRDKRSRKVAGWTWDALEVIRRMAGSAIDGRDEVDLRSLVASAMMTPDIRKRRRFAEGIDGEDVACSRDGQYFAIAEVRRENEQICSVYVFETEGLNSPDPLLKPYRTFSIYGDDMVVDGHQMKAHQHTGPRTEGFRSVCFSNDGTKLSIGTRNGYILEWHLAADNTESPTSEIKTCDAILRQIAYLPDDSGWVVLPEDGTRQLRIFDRETNACLWTSGFFTYSFVIDPSGDLFGQNGEGIWKVSGMLPREEILLPSQSQHSNVGKLSISHDGSTSIVSTADEIGHHVMFCDKAAGVRTIPLLAMKPDDPKQGDERFLDLGKSTLLSQLDTGAIILNDALSGEACCEVFIRDSTAPRLQTIGQSAFFTVSGKEASELYELRSPSTLSTLSCPAERSPEKTSFGAFAPSPLEITSFDISTDGKEITLLEGDQRRCPKARIRRASRKSGDTSEEWIIRANIAAEISDIRPINGNFVKCRGDTSHAVMPSLGAHFVVNSKGFEPVTGLGIPVRTSSPTFDVSGSPAKSATYHFSRTEIPETLRRLMFGVSLRTPREFPAGNESITIEYDDGEALKSVTIDERTFGRDASGWVLYFDHQTLLANRVHEYGVSVRVVLNSDDLELVAAGDGTSRSPAIELGAGFLVPSRHLNADSRSYVLGPIGSLSDGQILCIDDENTLSKWVNPSDNPRFVWEDSLNNRPSIRDLACANMTTILGTCTGQVFRLDANNQVTLLTNGPRGGVSWETSKDVQRVAVSRDETVAASGQLNGDVVLFDLTRNSDFERSRMTVHEQKISALAFRSTGDILATADSSGNLRLWERTGEKLNLLFQLDQLPNPVIDMQFTPDDQQLYFLCENERGLRIINFPSLRSVFRDMKIDW